MKKQCSKVFDLFGDYLEKIEKMIWLKKIGHNKYEVTTSVKLAYSPVWIFGENCLDAINTVQALHSNIIDMCQEIIFNPAIKKLYLSSHTITIYIAELSTIPRREILADALGVILDHAFGSRIFTQEVELLYSEEGDELPFQVSWEKIGVFTIERI